MIQRVLFSALLFILVLPQSACSQAQDVQKLAQEPLQITTSNGTTHEFQVEIARTQKEQNIGLMNRSTMPADHGMLFPFTPPRQVRFWMKNTLIPLDMLFIADNGVIYHIAENVQPHDLSGVSSEGMSAAVLEINGGLSAKYGIVPGSKIRHSTFKDTIKD